MSIFQTSAMRSMNLRIKSARRPAHTLQQVTFTMSLFTKAAKKALGMSTPVRLGGAGYGNRLFCS